MDAAAVALWLAEKYSQRDAPTKVQKMLADARVPQADVQKQTALQRRRVLERKQSQPDVVYTGGLLSALKSFVEHPPAPVQVFAEHAVVDEACYEWV